MDLQTDADDGDDGVELLHEKAIRNAHFSHPLRDPQPDLPTRR